VRTSAGCINGPHRPHATCKLVCLPLFSLIQNNHILQVWKSVKNFLPLSLSGCSGSVVPQWPHPVAFFQRSEGRMSLFSFQIWSTRLQWTHREDVYAPIRSSCAAIIRVLDPPVKNLWLLCFAMHCDYCDDMQFGASCPVSTLVAVVLRLSIKRCVSGDWGLLCANPSLQQCTGRLTHYRWLATQITTAIEPLCGPWWRGCIWCHKEGLGARGLLCCTKRQSLPINGNCTALTTDTKRICELW